MFDSTVASSPLISESSILVGTPPTIEPSISLLSSPITLALEPLPVVTLAVTDSAAGETLTGLTANPGLFTLSRTGDLTNGLTVNYGWSGTANNGEDFDGLTGVATFLPGSAKVTVAVNVRDDLLAESTETLRLALISGANSGYALGTKTSATVKIVDNETPVVSVAVTDRTAGETATGITANPGSFRLTRLGDLSNALTVNYGLSGTAVKGTDYSNLSGTVTFAANASTATVTVTPLDDVTSERSETAILTVLAGTGYGVGSAKAATVSILDNDVPVVTVKATDATATETAEGLTADPGVFTLTRLGNLASALTVNYALTGTAVNGTDYASLPASVTFAKNSATATVTVNPVNDGLLEADEKVTLTLATGLTYSLGSAKATTMTIKDNTVIVSIATNSSQIAETAYTYNGHTYLLTTTPKTWEEAQAEAQQYGGNLVTINDAAEEQWLKSTFGTDRHLWIGLTDKQSEGNFVWANGETVTYTNWTSDNPDNAGNNHPWGDQDYGVMNFRSVLQWDDEFGWRQFYGIIEIPKIAGQFTLTRTGDLTNPLTVNYTVSGTATNGIDYANLVDNVIYKPGQMMTMQYRPPIGSVTFAAGSSTATINVNPLYDNVLEDNEIVTVTLTQATINSSSFYNNFFENNETVAVTLTPNNAYQLGTATTANLAIVDNTTYPTQGYLKFDGQDDYFRIVLDEPETEVTHEFWFKTIDSNAGLMSVVDGELGEKGHDRHLYLENGNIKTRLHSTEVIGSQGLNLADDQWHHVAHVFGASVGGQRIYIDGNLVASGTKTTSDFNWQTAINLGFSYDGQSDYFSGAIDDFRIWNVARTQAEIQANFKRELQGNESGLVGYWKLNGTANDWTSNQNHGSLRNNPTWQSDRLNTVTISANDADVSESNNSGQFTLTRTGNIANSLTVYYSVSGTATNSTDYNTLTGFATFAEGSSTALVNINPIDDSKFEENETVILSLVSNSNYNINGANTAVVTITNSIPPNSFLAEYYNNSSLSGTPVYRTIESNINHQWGLDGPGNGVSNDNFSARYTTSRYLEPGLYNIKTLSDDGIKVIIDNEVLINKWDTLGHFSATFQSTGKTYTIVVEYRDTGLSASIDFDMAVLIPWKAEYFNNADLSGDPVYTEEIQADKSISQNWGSGSPHSDVNADNFSVRYTSDRYFASGLYQIKTSADDAIRLKIGDQLLVDQSASLMKYFRSEGGYYPIQVEYRENGGLANFNFEINPYQSYDNFGDPNNIANQWKASFYTYQWDTLTKAPIFENSDRIGTVNLGSNTRSDGQWGMNAQNWGAGSPASEVTADNFVMDAYTRINLTAEHTYKLWLRSDDGYRIWANNLNGSAFNITNDALNGSWMVDAYGGKEITFTAPQSGMFELHAQMYEGGGDAYFDLVVKDVSYINGYFVPNDIYNVWEKHQLGTVTSDVIDHYGWAKYQYFNHPTLGTVSVVRSNQGTYPLWGGVRQQYLKEGGLFGWLGAPRSGEQGIGNGVIRQDFANGYILWNGTATSYSHDGSPGGGYYNGYFVAKDIYDVSQKYQLGTVISALNYHESGAQYQYFNHPTLGTVSVVRSQNGVYPLWGGIRQHYLKEGGLNGWLGAPKSAETGIGNGVIRQDFANGYVLWDGSAKSYRSDGSLNGGTFNGYFVPGDFYAVWQAYQLGTVASNVTSHASGAEYQYFQHPTLGTVSVVKSQHGIFPLWGGIRSYYVNKTGGLNGPLGAPTSPEQGIGNGVIRQSFANGYILWNGSATAYKSDGSLLYPPSAPNPSNGGGSGGNTGLPINVGSSVDYNEYMYLLYRDDVGNVITQTYEQHGDAIDSVDGAGSDRKVYALTSGRIEAMTTDQYGGKYIKLWNSQLQRYFIYLHFDQFSSNLSVGQAINQGTFLGIEGSTGFATGVHTHVHVYDINRNRENPLNALTRLYGSDGGSSPNPPSEPNPSPDPNQVTIYEHDHFNGKAKTLGLGEHRYVGDEWNDLISSINIPSGWVVEAYEHDNFQGRKVVWDSSQQYVGDYWNDEISSLKILSNTSLPKEATWSNSSYQLYDSVDPLFSVAKSRLPDEGAGEYGSKKEEVDDLQSLWADAQEGLWSKIADIAWGLGYKDASIHLRHYLDNSGEPLSVDVNRMLRDMGDFQSKFDEQMKLAQDAVNYYIRSGAINEKQVFNVGTDWNYENKFSAEQSKYPNWFYSMGGFYYRVVATIEITPFANSLTINMKSKMQVYDRYNWDAGKGTRLLFILPISDSDLAYFHQIGISQEYDIFGDSSFSERSWTVST